MYMPAWTKAHGKVFSLEKLLADVLSSSKNIFVKTDGRSRPGISFLVTPIISFSYSLVQGSWWYTCQDQTFPQAWKNYITSPLELTCPNIIEVVHCHLFPFVLFMSNYCAKIDRHGKARMLNPVAWLMIITLSLPLKSIKFWSPMVSLEQHVAWYSLKNFFDLSLSSCLSKCWAWEIPSEFVIFLMQNPSLCSAVHEVVGDTVALYSETELKTRLFPSKSDTQVKGATCHVVSSTHAWQLPSSSAYSSPPLSLQNDVLESLLHIWPLWGLIFDSWGFFQIVLIFTYWTWPWATPHRFWACMLLVFEGLLC